MDVTVSERDDTAVASVDGGRAGGKKKEEERTSP
jgi:hypothetical protein